MTRKRFIKLLMADGYSRNEANDLAADINEGFSYDELYCIYRVIPQIGDICGRLKHAIEAMIESFCELIPTVVETLVQTITEMLPVAVEAAKELKALNEEMEGHQ